VHDVLIRDLEVDGRRFESDGRTPTDHRHPCDPDPTAARFPCAVRVAESEAHEARHWYSPFEADLSFSGAVRITIADLAIADSVKCGLAFGNHTSDIRIERVRIRRSGDYGIWAGMATDRGRTPLPLPDDLAALQPRQIAIDHCEISKCGAAAVFVEAREVSISHAMLVGNHREFPYNHDGGQIEVDFKGHDVRIEECEIREGPHLERTVIAPATDGQGWQRRQQVFRSVGIEVYGSAVLIRDCRIERNAHEGVHLNGARDVVIRGASTFVGNNHTARTVYRAVRHDPRQDITITTTDEYHRLQAQARNLRLEDIVTDGGLLVWSNGSVPRLVIDEVVLSRCRTMRARDPVVVGTNPDGSSLRGSGWRIEP
jgi:hypothetical protein